MSELPGSNGVRSSRCEAEPFLKFFAQEWMSHIVWLLGKNDHLRFGAIRRLLPPSISARVLSARLKSLEAGGYVERRDLSGKSLHVEYSLTPLGRTIDGALARSEAALADQDVLRRVVLAQQG